GGELPGDLPGLDLMPSLKSGHPLARKQIFGEGFAHDIADIENPEASLLYRWTIRDEWKLLLTYDGEVNRIRGPRKDHNYFICVSILMKSAMSPIYIPIRCRQWLRVWPNGILSWKDKP
ncbi:MAG: hypothetical protein ACPHRA_13085, partial [Limisphaerales bacterium]